MKLISFLKKYWLGVLTLIIALATFVFGGFYNEVIKSKFLTYTLLPSYNLGDEYFSGIVIENRGRASLTNVEISISDLGSLINSINIPNPHERMDVVSGGQGYDGVVLSMPRLSSGSSLSIYLLTDDNIVLEKDKTLIVSSLETTGKPGTSQNPKSISDVVSYILIVLLLSIALYMLYIGLDSKWFMNTVNEVTIGVDTALYRFILNLPNYQKKWLEELVDKKFTPNIFYEMHLGDVHKKDRESLLFLLLSWLQNGVIKINESDEEMTMELNPVVKDILRRTDLFTRLEAAVFRISSDSRLEKMNENSDIEQVAKEVKN